MARYYPLTPTGAKIAPETLEKHNAWVRQVVPSHQLLEFHLTHGWAPLCKFLDVPVPDVPFPRNNDTPLLVKQIKDALILG